MKKVLAAITILVTLALASPAIAASSSIELVSDGSPAFGEQVNFTHETTRSEFPWIINRCYTDFNGDGRIQTTGNLSPDLVLYQAKGRYESYYEGPNAPFTLGPTANWPSGPATCVASLIYWHNGMEKNITSLEYEVAG